jgi:serine/threonine-protein kinase RsbW
MIEPAAAIGWAERSEFVHRSWPTYPRHLAALRAEVRRWLAPLALPGDAKNDLLLAVNEAASNCIEHASAPATVDGTVELTFWTEPGSVCVEIVDHGRWRAPCGQPTGRGRGIAIMQRLIPVVLIHYDNRGIRVLLSHPLPGPRHGDPGRTGRRRDGGAVGGGAAVGRCGNGR